MSMEERVIDKLVELARNPTRDDMAAMDRMLNDARSQRDKVQREKDRMFAADIAAEPHLTELYKAAKNVLDVAGSKIPAGSRDRLRDAVKKAEPHVDNIPF